MVRIVQTRFDLSRASDFLVPLVIHFVYLFNWYPLYFATSIVMHSNFLGETMPRRKTFLACLPLLFFFLVPHLTVCPKLSRIFNYLIKTNILSTPQAQFRNASRFSLLICSITYSGSVGEEGVLHVAHFSSCNCFNNQTESSARDSQQPRCAHAPRGICQFYCVVTADANTKCASLSLSAPQYIPFTGSGFSHPTPPPSRSR